MGQQSSRPAFDSLLVRTHVQHALIQPDGRHNDVPTALATLVFLNGMPEHLRAAYESESASLRTWIPSPHSITDEEGRTRFLGDVRFQRAYLNYFSMENAKFSGNSKALALSHLLKGTKPLIYGLFGGLGRPLVFLSDAMELKTAVLVVEALTLSTVDWMEPIYEILSHPQLARPSREVTSPDQIINRIAYDGRLSGVMRSGPGFHEVQQIFSNPNAKAAVLEYVHQLDCHNIGLLVDQLSFASTMLLVGTHKPESPAFDFYLSCLPTWANSLRILHGSFKEQGQKVILARGVWLLFVLSYITQLRPVVEPSLLLKAESPEEAGGWQCVWADISEQGLSGGKYADLQLLRCIRSLWELANAYKSGGDFHLRAAWKLVAMWQRWTGLGADKEDTLNIRL